MTTFNCEVRREQTDEELMVSVQSGDRDAFKQIVERYRNCLGYYVKSTLPMVDVDDVLQDTWLQVFTKAHKYTPGRPFRPWLYSIVSHIGIDHQRRWNRHPTTQFSAVDLSEDEGLKAEDLVIDAHPDADPMTHLERQETVEDVREVLRGLSVTSREALMLRMDNVRYHEMASELNVPIGTVKSRISLACGSFRKIYAKRVDVCHSE